MMQNEKSKVKVRLSLVRMIR